MRKDIIRTKLKEIDENLSIITENLPDNYVDFSKLGLVKDGIYKKLEFCIESVFDICAIVNTDLELGIPESDENILENMIEHDILNKNLGNRLKLMKGFRNILVHRYGKIDDKIAFGILKENLSDFYDFIRVIEIFLENKD